MKRNTIEEYWRTLALPWEVSSYDGEMAGLGFIEKVATLNREHIRQRKNTALKVLRPYVNGKRCLDIGCAGGIFTLELLKHGADFVIGVDVSEEVIRVAEKRAKMLGVGERVKFYACTLGRYREFINGNIDLVVGLGILEYLKPELVQELLQFIKPKGFLFSFDERVYTLKTGLHYMYRLAKGIPYYKKFTRSEIAKLLASCGYSSVKFLREGSNSFVYSL